LYHLLLIPFTFGDELRGARIASVLFAALAMGAFWWCLRALRVPWPAFFAVGLLAIAPEFAYRLTYTRPLVLALALTFAGAGAILTGRGRLAFVLTFLYAHTHCSFQVLPCIALIHWLNKKGSDPFSQEKGSDPFSVLLWSIAGAVAGSIVTPYFPNNLAFWWTANVEVLRASWESGGLLRVGTEMLPILTSQLLSANLGAFIVSGVALYAMTRVERVSDHARTLLVVCGGFFVLTMLSQRFAELWAPFSVMLLAVVARDLKIEERVRIPAGAFRTAAGCAAVVVLAFGLRHTARDNGAAAADEDPPRWRAAARWMKANVPENETIFHLGWDEFPELFFEDQTHRYLIGQDATFFWVTNPDRCRLWARLTRGDAEDAWSPVRETFKARWAFVPRRYRSFLKLARRDARFTEVYSDDDAIVLRVDDDGAVVSGWEVSPDPAEPPVACSTAGFVDLARISRKCAAAWSSIASDGPGPAVLGITSDDDVTVRVNGETVFARSPDAPRSLSDVFDAPAAGRAEVEFPVTLAPGENKVEVDSCRAGDDFGFMLRVRPEGRP
ncbi:MAG TPA: hypothetical protein VJ826_16010, partial [Candidatus Polarisedimenticolaceae bacterium]|nr:hypothetical protein [Candidatus Polarisedimenticolaceae bacterium]